MTILKKVIGVLLLLLGRLISFSTLINLLKEIIIMVQMKEELSAYHFGVVIEKDRLYVCNNQHSSKWTDIDFVKHYLIENNFGFILKSFGIPI